MKKLVIIRLASFVAWFLGTEITAIALLLCRINPEDIMNNWWNLNFCYASGMIALYLFYFFAGKFFHDISIRKLIPIFFIWTLLSILSDAFLAKYLIFSSGSFILFSADVLTMGFTDNRYLAYPIGFFIEIFVLVTGILLGRITSGKISGGNFVYPAKFFAVIITTMTARFVRHIVVAVSDNPDINYLKDAALDLGWVISLLAVAVWYFYIGYKCHNTNLKIVIPIYFIWNAIGVALWRISGNWNAVMLCGGYTGFFNGIRVCTPDRFLWLVCIGAFLLEATFLTAGVLLRRYKRKN